MNARPGTGSKFSPEAFDLSVLPNAAARRMFLLAKAQRKAIAPRWFPRGLSDFLLLGSAKPTPPSPRRVAARALCLSVIVWRAWAEVEPDGYPDREKNRRDLTNLLKSLGVFKEFEREERNFLNAPFGKANPAAVNAGLWRAEGLAVLAWSLRLYPLNPLGVPHLPPDRLQIAVGFGDRERSTRILKTAELRPELEINKLTYQTTLLSWRFRMTEIHPGPLALSDFMASHRALQEGLHQDLPLVDGDIAIGGVPLGQADAKEIEKCRNIAFQRHVACQWLEGDDPVYSKVNPCTILSVF